MNSFQAIILILSFLVGPPSVFAKESKDSKKEEDLRIAENILLYQRDTGGWPKNYDRKKLLSKREQQKVLKDKGREDSTFDNGATHRELVFLAKIYKTTGKDRFKKAFLRGLTFTLKAQYKNGGWPQYYPRLKGYSQYITYNDGAMIGVMTLLKDIAAGDDPYEFISSKEKKRCQQAIQKGLECILNTQIVVKGKRTAWCAQHDHVSLEPRKARSYELPSISGSESVGIVRYLMSIENPDSRVKEAIEGAIQWFKEAQLSGIRLESNKTKEGKDRVVVKDPSAPPMWARFYQIGTNKPIFCSRDGIPRETLAEISYERRNGYSWLGYYAKNLLRKDYPKWKARHDGRR